MSARVELSDAELLLLDGGCSEKVQAEVDAARSRLDTAAAMPDVSPEMAGLIADAVTEAKTNGLLLWRATRARSCVVCGKRAGYWVFKSGPRRGREDWNRPLSFYAVEMADRFVRMENHLTLGCCQDCAQELRPLIAAALADVQAQVPDHIAAQGRPKWKKHGRRECPDCGWQGHEGEMRLLRAVMGGMYPGGCPSCPFDSTFLGRSFTILDGFDVVAEGAR